MHRYEDGGSGVTDIHGVAFRAGLYRCAETDAWVEQVRAAIQISQGRWCSSTMIVYNTSHYYCYSISNEVGCGVGCLVDVLSLQGQASGSGAACATPLTVLVAVEEVCHRLIVVCLGFEGPPVDGLRELLSRSSSGRQVATLSKDLLLVRVGSEAGHLGSFGWFTLKL